MSNDWFLFIGLVMWMGHPGGDEDQAMDEAPAEEAKDREKIRGIGV